MKRSNKTPPGPPQSRVHYDAHAVGILSPVHVRRFDWTAGVRVLRGSDGWDVGDSRPRGQTSCAVWTSGLLAGQQRQVNNTEITGS